MRRDTYQDMQSMLDNIRQIANVRYLYTAKLGEDGQPVYLIDGLDLGRRTLPTPAPASRRRWPPISRRRCLESPCILVM